LYPTCRAVRLLYHFIIIRRSFSIILHGSTGAHFSVYYFLSSRTLSSLLITITRPVSRPPHYSLSLLLALPQKLQRTRHYSLQSNAHPYGELGGMEFAKLIPKGSAAFTPETLRDLLRQHYAERQLGELAGAAVEEEDG
jgi:hypothetical protein